MARYTYTEEQYARIRSERAEHEWRAPLRHAYDCVSAVESDSVDDAWSKFWRAFESCTAGYSYRDRVLLKAYDEWARLGGSPEDFRIP
jgi:hypothetical protein